MDTWSHKKGWERSVRSGITGSCERPRVTVYRRLGTPWLLALGPGALYQSREGHKEQSPAGDEDSLRAERCIPEPATLSQAAQKRAGNRVCSWREASEGQKNLVFVGNFSWTCATLEEGVCLWLGHISRKEWCLESWGTTSQGGKPRPGVPSVPHSVSRGRCGW